MCVMRIIVGAVIYDDALCGQLGACMNTFHYDLSTILCVRIDMIAFVPVIVKYHNYYSETTRTLEWYLLL